MGHNADRADVAQLVERELPKLEVAGSRPVVRFPPWGHWPTSAFTRKQCSPNPAASRAAICPSCASRWSGWVISACSRLLDDGPGDTHLDIRSNRQAEAVRLSDLEFDHPNLDLVVLPNDTVQPQDSHPGH